MKDFVVALVVILLIVFAYIAGTMSVRPEIVSMTIPFAEQDIETSGFSPVNVTMDGNNIILTNGCKMITFSVTDDQAFSIFHGLKRQLSVRPLTHDILVDILTEFGINISMIKIDRFEDEIYKAHIVLFTNDKILELDARPSDSIALATRSGKTVYIKDSILDTHSTDIC